MGLRLLEDRGPVALLNCASGSLLKRLYNSPSSNESKKGLDAALGLTLTGSIPTPFFGASPRVGTPAAEAGAGC